MPNVDDECWNFRSEWIIRLLKISIDKMKYDYEVNYDLEVPKEIFDLWYHRFWDFNISTWKPKEDDRAFPGTFYSNRFYDVFEFMSYEVVDDMLKYIKKTCRELSKDEKDELMKKF